MRRRKERRLLLSSVVRPFGERHGDGFGVSYEGSHQIMWAQGIFRTRGTTTQWSIDFIAENLEIPTVTLHYPTLGEFVREIQKGYEYVGIAFISATMHKMKRMAEAVRKHAPSSKIILGGYGTVHSDAVLSPYADHICRGEGVAFMRKLLGESQDREIRQPVITQVQSLFSIDLPNRTGYVIAGLGCPNGCDFCVTSHYYKRRHIKFLPDGRSVLGAIEKLRSSFPDMDTFWVNDEDFLLDERRGRAFLREVRETSLPPLSLSIFSSVKALSQYKAEELVEMGVDFVWIGFEGKRAGYAKMNGRPLEELFRDLHHHGISVLASMIIGFEYQTNRIIREEFETLVGLRPSFSQFLIYGPVKGTSLYGRLEKEGRLVPEAIRDEKKQDGFSLVFRHPEMGAQEVEALQKSLYREEFRRLGPSVYRVFEDWVNGYENLKDHPSRRVREKALKYGRDAHRAARLIPAGRRYVDRPTAAWLEALQQRISGATGPMTMRERAQSRFMPLMLGWTDFKMRSGIGQQPEFTRRTYRAEGAAAAFRAKAACIRPVGAHDAAVAPAARAEGIGDREDERFRKAGNLEPQEPVGICSCSAAPSTEGVGFRSVPSCRG